MSEIDWSKAPEEYPIWIESLRDGDPSGWHKDVGLAYRDEHGREWTKPEEGFYIVHMPPALWTGTGLPPVGTVCEVDGEKVFVVAHHMNGINAIYAEAPDSGLLYYGEPNEFRPIRTPEQIAAEEREKAYRGMIDDLAAVMGISNIDQRECDVLHALVDAGYRKTDAAK